MSKVWSYAGKEAPKPSYGPCVPSVVVEDDIVHIKDNRPYDQGDGLTSSGRRWFINFDDFWEWYVYQKQLDRCHPALLDAFKKVAKDTYELGYGSGSNDGGYEVCNQLSINTWD